MSWQPVRIALLCGAVAAMAVSSARADCCAPAPCAPAMRTICVTECVPQTYTTTRTCYRYENKVECYTAYKSVCVPETRTRVCTVYKRVPEVRTECRNVCVKVPTVEERTVMQTRWENQTYTKMVCKTVDRGHWECKEVPCSSGPLTGLFHRGGHDHGCNGCGNCDSCCPPPTRTVKCWVPCKVTVQCPVTCCKRVCIKVPCKIKVNVFRTEVRQEKYQVCSYRCVPENRTETYTVNLVKCVPCQATRNVCVCVPYQQSVTCTRMVTRTVTRQVPCESPAPACGAPCASSAPCAAPCSTCGHHRHQRSCHRCAGLFHREHGCGCGCP